MSDSTDNEGNRAAFDRALFEQDLDEVYLLLDHISGRTDKSLEGLKVKLLDEKGALVEMDSASFIATITRLRYPPEGDEAARSRAAANVLTVKDRLSALAAPARGSTIAYTNLFVDARFWRRRGDTQDTSRVALAGRAFPSFVAHAATFSRITFTLLIATLLSLVVVAMTQWDVASGRFVLSRVEQLNRDLAALQKENTWLSPSACIQRFPLPGTVSAEVKPGDDNNRATSENTCRRAGDIQAELPKALADVRNFVARESGDCTVDLSFLCMALAVWTVDATVELSPSFLGSILDVFNSFVLPVLFAMLGTMVRTFRSIREKIGESVLAPRDRMLALINLPMGFIAGLAVGLFFTPGAASAVQGTAMPITLTTSGIGFLAGYGAEAFFALLDAVIKRVFNLETGNGGGEKK